MVKSEAFRPNFPSTNVCQTQHFLGLVKISISLSIHQKIFANFVQVYHLCFLLSSIRPETKQQVGRDVALKKQSQTMNHRLALNRGVEALFADQFLCIKASSITAASPRVADWLGFNRPALSPWATFMACASAA